MSKTSPTIYDIAKEVNASPATVARVLRKSDYPVSPELKAKIQKAAKDLNYVPNMLGRQLKTKISSTIGVVIPTITNPYYSSVVLGIEELCTAKGYNVLLCNSHQSLKQEEQCLKMLLEKQIAGLIISPISEKSNAINQYIEKGLNVVAFDQLLKNDNIIQIDFDYKKGGYSATKHLIDRGHKKIAYLTAPLDRPSRNLIYEGYKQALMDHQIHPEDKWFLVSEVEESYRSISEFNNGRKLAQKLLELPDLPTAAFVCNDMTACGVMNYLDQKGIRVPDQLSLVGFDNIELGELTNPPLTTIEQPKYELGKLAGSLLMNSIEEKYYEPYKVVLPSQLIERKSVRSINKRRAT